MRWSGSCSRCRPSRCCIAIRRRGGCRTRSPECSCTLCSISRAQRRSYQASTDRGTLRRWRCLAIRQVPIRARVLLIELLRAVDPGFCDTTREYFVSAIAIDGIARLLIDPAVTVHDEVVEIGLWAAVIAG